VQPAGRAAGGCRGGRLRDDPSLAYPLATCAEVDGWPPSTRHVLPVVADVRDGPRCPACASRSPSSAGWTPRWRAGVMTGGQPLWETTARTVGPLYSGAASGVRHLPGGGAGMLAARPRPAVVA